MWISRISIFPWFQLATLQTIKYNHHSFVAGFCKLTVPETKGRCDLWLICNFTVHETHFWRKIYIFSLFSYTFNIFTQKQSFHFLLCLLDLDHALHVSKDCHIFVIISFSVFKALKYELSHLLLGAVSTSFLCERFKATL